MRVIFYIGFSPKTPASTYIVIYWQLSKLSDTCVVQTDNWATNWLTRVSFKLTIAQTDRIFLKLMVWSSYTHFCMAGQPATRPRHDKRPIFSRPFGVALTTGSLWFWLWPMWCARNHPPSSIWYTHSQQKQRQIHPRNSITQVDLQHQVSLMIWETQGGLMSSS